MTASPGRSSAETLADRLLDGAIGLGHRRQVGLGLDHEIDGPVARQRDRVGDVGQLEREREVIGDGAHRGGSYGAGARGSRGRRGARPLG